LYKIISKIFNGMNLKNKVVVITGSSGGLGKALAVQFLEEKAEVVVSDISRNELRKTAKELGAVEFVADVTKEGDMQELAAFVVKKFGKIDIWINNAGIGAGHKPVEKINSQLAHKTMEVNFFGTFYGSRSVMKYMKKQKSGTIVNIVSIRSLVPNPLSVVYSSSKWAVRGLTEALRTILKSDNISVIAIHPAGIKTSFYGKTKPADYKKYMEPSYVAARIIQNLKLKKPKEEIIVKKK